MNLVRCQIKLFLLFPSDSMHFFIYSVLLFYSFIFIFHAIHLPSLINLYSIMNPSTLLPTNCFGDPHCMVYLLTDTVWTVGACCQMVTGTLDVCVSSWPNGIWFPDKSTTTIPIWYFIPTLKLLKTKVVSDGETMYRETYGVP